jgi:hypothetical protein
MKTCFIGANMRTRVASDLMSPHPIKDIIIVVYVQTTPIQGQQDRFFPGPTIQVPHRILGPPETVAEPQRTLDLLTVTHLPAAVPSHARRAGPKPAANLGKAQEVEEQRSTRLGWEVRTLEETVWCVCVLFYESVQCMGSKPGLRT